MSVMGDRQQYVHDNRDRAFAGLVASVDNAERFTAEDIARAERGRGRLFLKAAQLFEQYDVLITPTLGTPRSEEHTSELQSLMRISYAVFCLKKKKTQPNYTRQK